MFRRKVMKLKCRLYKTPQAKYDILWDVTRCRNVRFGLLTITLFYHISSFAYLENIIIMHIYAFMLWPWRRFEWQWACLNCNFENTRNFFHQFTEVLTGIRDRILPRLGSRWGGARPSTSCRKDGPSVTGRGMWGGMEYGSTTGGWTS